MAQQLRALPLLYALSFPRLKILLNSQLAFVPCPAGGCTVPKDILHVQSSAALDEKSDHFLVAGGGSLVQRRRMRMATERIVTVWIFTRIQQEANNLNMAKLRRQCERQMAVVFASAGKQPAEVVDVPRSGRDRQIDASAAPD